MPELAPVDRYHPGTRIRRAGTGSSVFNLRTGEIGAGAVRAFGPWGRSVGFHTGSWS